jgi:hypothetical protein
VGEAGTNGGNGGSGTIWIQDYTSAANDHYVTSEAMGDSIGWFRGSGAWRPSTHAAINSITAQILTNGSFTGGMFTLYGVP